MTCICDAMADSFVMLSFSFFVSWPISLKLFYTLSIDCVATRKSRHVAIRSQRRSRYAACKTIFLHLGPRQICEIVYKNDLVLGKAYRHPSHLGRYTCRWSNPQRVHIESWRASTIRARRWSPIPRHPPLLFCLSPAWARRASSHPGAAQPSPYLRPK